MKRADDLAQRLKTLFAPPTNAKPRFQIVDGPATVTIEEREKAGYARILCKFGEGVRVIQWTLQTGDLRPIASEKNADGAMLVVRPDGALEAHVMECKQTVDSKHWNDALVQIEWTVIRLLAIAGALHERVERVVLYTAFRRNALAVDESEEPVQFELPLDDEDSLPYRRQLPMMRSATETEVALPGWTSPFLHVKVQKDEEGHARVDLRVGQRTR